MKKVSFCPEGKGLIIFLWLCLTVICGLILHQIGEKYTAMNTTEFLMLTGLFTALYIGGTISCAFTFIGWSGAMRMYEDKIETRMRITRGYHTIHIDEIHEIIIQCESVLTKHTSSELSLRVNSSGGFILAYGRKALDALLKTYPDMKFRVKYTGYLLGRKNAILLSRRGCLGVHKRRLVAKRFHIPEEKLMPIDNPQSTEE